MSLSQNTIAKNNEIKQTIEEYYESLKRELDSLNSIIGNIEKLSDNDFQVGSNDKWCLHADGAYKPIGAVELGHALKPQSPFYEEAARQERYLNFILPNPFSTAERRYLEKAVVKENKRLMALRLQQNGQNPLEVLPTENEAYLDNTEGLDWSAIARDVSTWNHPGEARTPQECKSRWLTQHPKLNYEDWTDEETKKLREIVQDKQRSGSLDWDVVSESLGTNRTALDCIKQYQANNKTTLKWTEELDKKLLAAVEKYGYSNWALVAPAVSLELSPNQCQIRYERTLNPTLKHGKFTPEEDEMLLKAVEFHGCEWKKVALMVFGRSNTQCRSRWLSLDRRKEREQQQQQQQGKNKSKSKRAEILDMEHASTSTPTSPVPPVENATAPTTEDTREKEPANDTTRVVLTTQDASQSETQPQPRRVPPKARPVTSAVKDTTESAIDTTGVVSTGTTGDTPEIEPETETGTGTDVQLPRKVPKARPVTNAAKEASKSIHPMRTRTRATATNPE